MKTETTDHYRDRIHLELVRLGIPMQWIIDKKLPFYPEASKVVLGDIAPDGRECLMTPDAAIAWQSMKMAAQNDGIMLEVVSSFRTIERQIEIIQAKLDHNMPMETILTLSAPPGYSEHHTGRALDINTPGCRATEPEFEHTSAYAWLQSHAHRFAFSLSYPKNNTLGFIHEPWHWFYGERT